ncbi:unnamed protein product [Cylicocyclus nassatus]|uniref:Uncharacterized protein n=1 Tax=Cylicocyclus nassatus TaxID=53992 RepID=A0AA36HHZ2_CYLNA|nr:unnamed protein product [Cylicocyclus nassatus]
MIASRPAWRVFEYEDLHETTINDARRFAITLHIIWLSGLIDSGSFKPVSTKRVPLMYLFACEVSTAIISPAAGVTICWSRTAYSRSVFIGASSFELLTSWRAVARRLLLGVAYNPVLERNLS